MNKLDMYNAITGCNSGTSITNSEYIKLSGLLQDETGIKLPPSKKILVMARLGKRLRELGITSFGQYYDYLQSLQGKQYELELAINAISTNKTEFFRENQQFIFLNNKVFPEYSDRYKTMFKKIDIWSAGCSSGQEPYSLAMVGDDYFGARKKLYYSVLATDISTKVLDIGKQAIYPEKDIKEIPLHFQKRYLLKGKNKFDGYYQIAPELCKNVTFQRHNLMIESFHSINQMDIIFCRNVIIYFDRETQERLITKFFETLRPGGYLFIGASETLFNIESMFKHAGPNIYKKTGR